MHKFVTLAALAFTLSWVGCGPKKPINVGTKINLSLVEDGSVAQFGSQKINQRRLYFSYGGGGNPQFSGSRQVFSFQVENPNSLSPDAYNKYYGMVLTDSEGKVVHQALLKKDYYFERFEKNPDYFISFYRGALFIDVPMTVEMDKIIQLSLVDLEREQVVSTIDIDDIEKPYREPLKPEGWTKEIGVYKIFGEAKPEDAFDFVLLTEGFTAEELKMGSVESLMSSKFGNYVSKYVLPLLETEPFKSRKKNINVWVVATPSIDSGISNPFQNKDLKTVYHSTFGAYCKERSLIVRDQMRALEMASHVPFDQVLVLMNDETYGGQGGDIATFSMHERADYLIKHELAHSISMLADEYKSFSDGIAHSTCKDNLIGSRATHSHKNWGRNGFYEDRQYLAPNIDKVVEKSQVKWASFLNESSPVVYFTYPQKTLNFDEEELSLEGEYIATFDRDNMLITMGLEMAENSLLRVLKKVEVNGVEEPFKTFSNGQMFAELESRGMKKGQTLSLKLTFSVPSEDIQNEEEANAYKKRIVDFLSGRKASAHFVTLPSTTFTGDVAELGIFQGSGVDLEKTVRSSYKNIMGSFSMEFDRWQEYAYGLFIDRHFVKQEE